MSRRDSEDWRFCWRPRPSGTGQYLHLEPWPRILGPILVKGWLFDYALFEEDLTMVLSQILVIH